MTALIRSASPSLRSGWCAFTALRNARLTVSASASARTPSTSYRVFIATPWSCGQHAQRIAGSVAGKSSKARPREMRAADQHVVGDDAVEQLAAAGLGE